ncbi:hypothetical protein BDF21DRAFT_433039 [Thamnidium elegans]|nr:hypothetical protein BDF21DRAFT_433039 [Thamnidium elegans]
MTIHKVQNITIDAVKIHLDHIPSHGQMDVAVFLVRKTDDLNFFGTYIVVIIK